MVLERATEQLIHPILQPLLHTEISTANKCASNAAGGTRYRSETARERTRHDCVGYGRIRKFGRWAFDGLALPFCLHRRELCGRLWYWHFQSGSHRQIVRWHRSTERSPTRQIVLRYEVAHRRF
jgi:hypothetical protein